MKKEALFWDSCNDGVVKCRLCSHYCKIKEGAVGLCGVRKNEAGRLYSLIYGSCSGVAQDPIEKKPLNHFYPGSVVLSLGSVGCNFFCLHCQNYHISTAEYQDDRLQYISPEKSVDLAKSHGCRGIAWTYNEPTIWYEYTLDSAQLAKKAGLYTVYVTNGYITEEPLRTISPYLDAMNVDVKAFSEDFYKKVCNASLAPVLQTCELAHRLGIHLEVTYLLIPGMNDSTDELEQFCTWVVDSLGDSVPVYFSRFHPYFKLDNVPPTPMKTLIAAFHIAKDAGIKYPYLGNIADEKYENTSCPFCSNLLVARQGFTTKIIGLKDGRCIKCNASIPIVTD